MVAWWFEAKPFAMLSFGGVTTFNIKPIKLLYTDNTKFTIATVIKKNISIHNTNLLIAILLQLLHLPIIVRLLIFRLEKEDSSKYFRLNFASIIVRIYISSFTSHFVSNINT